MDWAAAAVAANSAIAGKRMAEFDDDITIEHYVRE
jgi:hypothetical protein